MASTFVDLRKALRASVPWRMRDYADQGGPTAIQQDSARKFIEDFAECCFIEAFFNPNLEVGNTWQLFNDLAMALAALAWLPGGISLFGDTWDIRHTAIPESELLVPRPTIS